MYAYYPFNFPESSEKAARVIYIRETFNTILYSVHIQRDDEDVEHFYVL